MEDFVDQDTAKFDSYYETKAAELKQRYGQRIQDFMMMPIIDNIYKKYNLKSDDAAGSKILLATAGWKDDTANLIKQNNPKVCPLYQ